LSVDAADWRQAFQMQCTEKLLKRVGRFAERRARKLRLVGGTVDDYYVRELVQDVLADTALGVLHWDPCAERLEDHVTDAIATRVHHDVTRAKRFPHTSIDGADSEASQAIMAAVEASLLDEQEAPTATIRFAEDSFGELRELAAADPDLQRLLDALAAGATCKDDVLFVTGMSELEYRAARNRLDRLARALPGDAQPTRPRARQRSDTSRPTLLPASARAAEVRSATG
jgi:hypothetical protein